MKDIIIHPEHKKAAAIFLAIFALTAMFLFSSCGIVRREGSTSPCSNKQAYSGYGSDNQGRHVGLIKRRSL